jgi:hypothetical protein
MSISISRYFRAAVLLSAVGLAGAAVAEDAPQLFKKTQVSDQFYSEGAAIGDFNKDGKMDVVIGPYWYEGPDFGAGKKHQYAGEDFMTKAYDPHG